MNEAIIPPNEDLHNMHGNNAPKKATSGEPVFHNKIKVEVASIVKNHKLSGYSLSFGETLGVFESNGFKLNIVYNSNGLIEAFIHDKQKVLDANGHVVKTVQTLIPPTVAISDVDTLSAIYAFTNFVTALNSAFSELKEKLSPTVNSQNFLKQVAAQVEELFEFNPPKTDLKLLKTKPQETVPN